MKKLMKKAATLLMIGAMTLASATMASANETKYVTNDIGINVRQSPSPNSAKLGCLFRGEAVDVIQELDFGWTQINYNGRTAYVFSEVLSDMDQMDGMTEPEEAVIFSFEDWEDGFFMDTCYDIVYISSTPEEVCLTVNVPSGYLALRTECTYDYENEIGQLWNGDIVYVDAAAVRSGSQYWYVYAPGIGMSGYVNADYLV